MVMIRFQRNIVRDARQTEQLTYVDAVKVVGVHDSSLIELDLCEMTLEQPFQLQVWLLPTSPRVTN